MSFWSGSGPKTDDRGVTGHESLGGTIFPTPNLITNLIDPSTSHPKWSRRRPDTERGGRRRVAVLAQGFGEVSLLQTDRQTDERPESRIQIGSPPTSLSVPSLDLWLPPRPSPNPSNPLRNTLCTPDCVEDGRSLSHFFRVGLNG